VESDVALPGAIAASAGNHALAMAYNGRALGIPITVVRASFFSVFL
jgi:threonine dehydratase